MKRVILIISIIACLICGCGKEKLPAGYENLTVPEDLLQSEGAKIAGKSLFSIHCGSCHGDRGKGDGLRSPLLTKLPDFTKQEWKNNITPKQVYFIIMDGKEHSAMVGWRNYIKDKDAWNLTAYILSLGGK